MFIIASIYLYFITHVLNADNTNEYTANLKKKKKKNLGKERATYVVVFMGSVMCSLMILIHTLYEHLSTRRGTLECSVHCSGWNPLVPLGNTHPNWI